MSHFKEHTLRTPMEFEPKRPHRFIVLFPETMEIKPLYVKGLSKLSYDFRKKEWNVLSLTLYDIIGEEISQKLVETLVNTRKKILRFKIQSLDPTGVVVETFEVIGDLVELDLGTYDYKLENELHLIKIEIKPNDIIF
jgi:hypothetical protein